MAQHRKILIADPDLEAARGLSKALRQRGYQVHYAPDGSRALEVAVLRHPDLILFDEGCRLIEAKTFSQILRTNPRTEDIPVVLTTAAFDADKVRGLRDGYLKKPFNRDEVISRVDHIFRRTEAANQLKGEQKEIEGNLAQLGIPDLMQVLSMNKRSGKLNLNQGSDRGEIQVTEGRPTNARIGIVEGEKALFRLLMWTEGTFAFVPGSSPLKPRISRAMDDALLEGMRQSDEVKRLLPSLPPQSARLQLAPEADSTKGQQHPITAQVMDLLRQPRPLRETVDLCPATDLEVLSALSSLLQKGLARVVEEQEPAGRGPLLGPAEIHALRSRLVRGKASSRVAVAKVFACGNGPSAARKLLTVPGLVRVAADPPALKSGFGTLGAFEVSEALRIDFCVLPPSEAARPLWRPFCGGAVGTLVLDTSDAAVKLARFLAWEIGLPLAVVGPVPDALKGAPAGVVSIGEDLLEGLRALLRQSISPPPRELPHPAAAAAHA
jgi:DNA-binding response OmpR family regulator